jgi:hypothetical protein
VHPVLEALAFRFVARSHGLGTRAASSFNIQKPSLFECERFEEKFTFSPAKVVLVYARESLDSEEIFLLNSAVKKIPSRFFLR